MIGKPISSVDWDRAVWDPLGSVQSRAAYELQAIAYARWIARRDNVSLKRVHSASCIWVNKSYIARVDFFRGKKPITVSIEIPNPNPDLAHRVRNGSGLECAA